MNGLNAALAWSTVQVTFVALAALALERLASRRGPRAGSWVAAASLGIIVVLAPLASCPLPGGRGVALAIGGSPPFVKGVAAEGSRPRAEAEGTRGTSPGDGFAWSSSLVWRLRGAVALATDSSQTRRPLWSRAWGPLLLAGAGLALARLLIGLWGVHDCRRRGIPVEDPGVLALVEALRAEIGIARCVAVRELPGLATAAAVGWRRPLVLLPGDWRTWDDSERLAVLAHELAHVARADYASGVVARVGQALHVYHPLVHYIVARLQLQQELAADALGARLAGGRRPYLLALSRLALRQEGTAPAWPARAFLPARGHLIRRIHVLNAEHPAKDGSLPAPGRALAVALLVAVGLAASALRGPSPSLAADAPPEARRVAVRPPAEAAGAPKPAPFELSYVPHKAMGFLAVRPAEIFRRPGMKPYLDALNVALAKVAPVKAESIEQATVGLSMQTRDRRKGEPGKFMMGGVMVRSVADFDWKALVEANLKAWGGAEAELVEVRFEGRVYYKAMSAPLLGPAGGFYFPDGRTLVADGEESLRHMIKHGAGSRPESTRGADWDVVDRGLLALAIDNRGGRWNLDAEVDTPEDLPIAQLLQGASRWVVGVDGAEGLMLRAIATCGSDDAGRSVAGAAEALMARGRAALELARTTPPKGHEDAHRDLLRTANDLLRACKVRRDGAVVDLSAENPVSFKDLATILTAGGL